MLRQLTMCSSDRGVNGSSCPPQMSFKPQSSPRAQLGSVETVAGRSAVLTPAEQARQFGHAWERVPNRPRRQLRVRVISPDGKTHIFYLGPHTPRLAEDDVALIHRLWLDLTQATGTEDVHHRDVVHVALRHLADDLTGPLRRLSLCRCSRPTPGLWGMKVLHMCWPLSEGSSKCIPIDAQPNHQIVQAFRLGKAPRATHQPLAPGPEIAGLALAFLRVLLAYVRLLGSEMSLLGPPAVRGILGEATGLAQLWPPQADGGLTPSDPIRSPLPALGIHRVPAPSRMHCRLPKPPHCVKLGAQSTTHLPRVRSPAFPLALRGRHERQPRRLHGRPLRRFLAGLG